MLCHYFFAPCGENGLLHLPLPLCPEACHYVESVCEDEWRIANNLLQIIGLSSIDCPNIGVPLQGISPCCIDAGIELKSIGLPDPPFLTQNSSVTEMSSTAGNNNTVMLVVVLVVAFLLLIIAVIVVSLVAVFVKRRSIVKKFQIDILRSVCAYTNNYPFIQY